MERCVPTSAEAMTERPILKDKEVMTLARETGLPHGMYDTEGWRAMLALFAQAVRRFDAAGDSLKEGK